VVGVGREWLGGSTMKQWPQIIDIVETQSGVIGKAQLDDMGVTRAQMQTLLRDRRLERVAPRVWRVAGTPPTWRQDLQAGLLSLGKQSWISHEAAAQLHRFDRTPPDRVEFLVFRSHRNSALGFPVHAARRWSPVDAIEIDGLRVTSATRTVLDLANAGAHPDRVAAAIDTAVRLGLSSPETILRRLGQIRTRGWNGVRRIEQLLEHAGGHTMLERRFLELVDSVGLPRPVTQQEFRTPDGRFVARVDFYFRAQDLVVEVTGKVGHSTPEERMRDAQRRNELQELGLRVYEFTWEDVTQRPIVVTMQLRKLLR
jgi:hypothetical protein